MSAPDSEFEVEKVLDERGGKFKVKWRGFPLSEATWEPMDHLRNAPELVAAFRDENKKKAAQKKKLNEKKKKKKKKGAQKKKPDKKTKAATAKKSRNGPPSAGAAAAAPAATPEWTPGAVDWEALPDAPWLHILNDVGLNRSHLRSAMSVSKKLHRLSLDPSNPSWQYWVGPTLRYRWTSDGDPAPAGLQEFDRQLLLRPQFEKLSAVVLCLNNRKEKWNKKLEQHELAVRGEIEESDTSVRQLLLAKSPSLRTLWFCGKNKTRGDELDEWPDELDELDESDESDESDEFGTDDLAAVLAQCRLEELVLSQTALAIDVPRAFDSLPAASALKSCQFGAEVEISTGLIELLADRCPALQHVRLHYVLPTTPLHLLFRKCKELKTLKIAHRWEKASDTLITSDVADNVVDAAAGALLQSAGPLTSDSWTAESLQELRLPLCYDLGSEESFVAMAMAFPNLRVLDLSLVSNGPSTEEILAAAQASSWSESMRELLLPLYDGQSSPQACVFHQSDLTSLLRALPNLQKLQLWLDDEEASLENFESAHGCPREWKRKISSVGVLAPTNLARVFKDAGWEEARTKQLVLIVRCAADPHNLGDFLGAPRPRFKGPGAYSKDASLEPLAKLDPRQHKSQASAQVPEIWAYRCKGPSKNTEHSMVLSAEPPSLFAGVHYECVEYRERRSMQMAQAHDHPAAGERPVASAFDGDAPEMPARRSEAPLPHGWQAWFRAPRGWKPPRNGDKGRPGPVDFQPSAQLHAQVCFGGHRHLAGGSSALASLFPVDGPTEGYASYW
jgi:hypothetical protein